MTGSTREIRPADLEFEASKTLRRIWPRIREVYEEADIHAKPEPAEVAQFEARVEAYWMRLFDLLFQLYGRHYDFHYHLEQTAITLTRGWLARSHPLKALDHSRENNPEWYLSQKMVGGALYVDLFSGNLQKLRAHIPYLRDLGLTYLHLMPLFAVRPGDSDGGYAISNYRTVNPQIGTIEDLESLAHELREVGISLTLDFVFNHTSDDHEWAVQAQSGVREYQEFYYIFPDRTIPDQYERTLREIFPTVRRGNFTWHDGMHAWVWTTFNSFQWDLNYANPAVFRAMLDEMLFIANRGVEILRLDAVAFIWKRMGTNCENQPEAHTLIRAFNLACRMAAPGLVFKSEAIVHPDEVVRYIAPDECQLSYNPTLMALMWEAIATRETKLLQQSLSHRHRLPENCTWVNYLRCHDDIGWAFDDGDAWSVGIDPWGHRQFLNRFYTGQFDGSFAKGVPFQHNPDTGDMRISGTMASLAGLEQALESGDEVWRETALRRINLLYGIICSVGGIPLIYLGEEWGLLNDYGYVNDPAKMADSRWVHRPRMKWELMDELQDHQSHRSRIFRNLQHLFERRATLPALAGNELHVYPSPSPHALMFARRRFGSMALILANFSEHTLALDGQHIRQTGMGHFFIDHLSGREYGTRDSIVFAPYDFLWLVPDA
ncbi:MAG: alpha-amylase family protein [Opitutales bacterium]